MIFNLDIVRPFGIEMRLGSTVPEFVNFYTTGKYFYLGYGLKKIDIDNKIIEYNGVNLSVPSILSEDIISIDKVDLYNYQITVDLKDINELFNNFIRYIIDNIEKFYNAYYVAMLLVKLIESGINYGTYDGISPFKEDILANKDLLKLYILIAYIDSSVFRNYSDTELNEFIEKLTNYSNDKELITLVAYYLNELGINISNYKIFENIDISNVDLSNLGNNKINLDVFKDVLSGVNFTIEIGRKKSTELNFDFNDFMFDMLGILYNKDSVYVYVSDSFYDKVLSDNKNGSKIIAYMFIKFNELIKKFKGYKIDIEKAYLYFDYVKASERGKGSYVMLLVGEGEVILIDMISANITIEAIQDRLEDMYNKFKAYLYDTYKLVREYIKSNDKNKLLELIGISNDSSIYDKIQYILRNADKSDKTKLLIALTILRLMNDHNKMLDDIKSIINIANRQDIKFEGDYKTYYNKLKSIISISNNLQVSKTSIIDELYNKYTSKSEDDDLIF